MITHAYHGWSVWSSDDVGFVEIGFLGSASRQVVSPPGDRDQVWVSGGTKDPMWESLIGTDFRTLADALLWVETGLLPRYMNGDV